MSELTGLSIIGFERAEMTRREFRARQAGTGKKLDPPYYTASGEQLRRAVELAGHAFTEYRRRGPEDRARLLRMMAERLEARKDALVARAHLETALPEERLQAETGRTCNQLRLFAQVVEEGSWVDARIDHGDPTREPIPKPDIRSMLRPLGPIAVFGASNFPIAISVAGGDTASALAAGNTVIVKAHPAHPGTAEIAGHALMEAARQCEMPEGIFSLLFDERIEVGTDLVQHPLVRGVGFTGSHQAGRSIMDLAANRPEPIPVFAEMGSINPVFILPGVLKEGRAALVSELKNAITQGVGQFCTRPGILILKDYEEGREFGREMARALAHCKQELMLTAGIADAYGEGTAAIEKVRGTESLLSPESVKGKVTPGLFSVESVEFLQHEALRQEVFGPSSILVFHSGPEDLLQVARAIQGQLTSTIWGTEEDLNQHQDLVELLAERAGRLIFNGVPTGVEVCHAMVHGGPYPATSDGRSTSIGTRAIRRFCRLICYQDFPDSALPSELREGNPRQIRRLVDGKWTA